MDRNLIIAFALSALVLLVWQSSMQPPPGPPPGVEQAVEGVEPVPSATTGETAAPAETSRYTDLPAGPAAPAPARARELAAEPAALEPASLITVDRELFEAVLTSRGGALHSWRLKDYSDEYGDSLELVEGAGALAGVTPFPGLEIGRAHV